MVKIASNFLDTVTFRTVVEHTPLVAIDLIVQNEAGEVLLGLRRNRPAQGFWFVPGGRVRKNETLDAAFMRLTETELGQCITRDCAKFIGVYEHLYTDSVFDNSDSNTTTSTHYVVLGYRLLFSQANSQALPLDQHDCFRWWTTSEVQADSQVHDNSRAYLSALVPNTYE